MFFVNTSEKFETTLASKHPVKRKSKEPMQITEAVAQRCSIKKLFLKISQYSQESTYARASFDKVAGLRPGTLFKKKTLAQVFSCEFCEIFKTTFYYRTSLVAASEINVKSVN